MRTIDLLSYLPPYMKGYREMQHIMNVENPELQFISDGLETLRDNQFIVTCNERGIARFEKMLGIESLPSDTLETRIGRVGARWIDTIPYTIKGLKNKLDVLLGEGTHKETVDCKNFYVTITVDIEASNRFKAVNELLEDIIPVNMVFGSLYDGNYDINIETKIELYSSNIPICGTVVCGGRSL